MLPDNRFRTPPAFPEALGIRDSVLREEILPRIRQVAQAENLPLIGARFLAPDGSLPAELMPDGTHPSEPGYAIWGRALVETGLLP